MRTFIESIVEEIKSFFSQEDNELEQYDIIDALVSINNDLEDADVIYCLTNNRSLSKALLSGHVNYLTIHELAEQALKGNGGYFIAKSGLAVTKAKVLSKPEVVELVFDNLHEIVRQVIMKPFLAENKYIYECFVTPFVQQNK
jgi:hypothetical protein